MNYPLFKIHSTPTESKDHFTIQSLPPLSLYIHYPWCLKKCPYCDFNSHAVTQHQPNEHCYLESLVFDLQQQLPLIWGRMVHTIFIGGGTPNLISGAGMDYLLNQIRTLVPLQPNAEITMEANPGAFSKQKLKAYHAAGVNRISIGIQSLNQRQLTSLGRVHSPEEALETLETALAIFGNVNADLMYALPEQTEQEAKHDIRQLTERKVPHISAYQLTIEPNTWFYHHPPALPEEENLSAIEATIHNHLSEHHYKRYEISAFAKQNYQCQHNLNYWNFGDYIGIGAGAHGKLTFHDRIIRTRHKKKPKDYIQSVREQNFISQFSISIPRQELSIQFLMNALRLIDGFNPTLFNQRTGLNISNIQQQLLLAKSKQLISINDDLIQPTPKGINFLNNLLEIFL